MRRRCRRGLALATRQLALGSMLLLGASGCVRHVHPYSRKTRTYKADAYAPVDAARTPGSLWSEGSHNLFEDAKARRIGDILTISVGESSDATRDASTTTAHESSMQLGISSFYTAIAKLVKENPTFDPASLISAATKNDFTGAGNTTRSGTLDAILPVRIKSSLPNGDFYVEGHKVLLLNEEESFLYISGVVRPIDVLPDNSVPSSKLADVELEYTGRGVITEADRVPWFQRFVSWVWPF
jgi:flagellar L-ring protein precursor FlgH